MACIFPSEPSWLLLFKPEIHCLSRKCILFRDWSWCVCLCVCVCVCYCVSGSMSWETTVSANCGGKWPQTAHTETHRLQSTIHLSHHPYLCFLSPPTEHLAGSQTPVPPSIYPLPSSSTRILSSIHLPPSHDLLNTYRPSVFVRHSPIRTYCSIRTFSNKTQSQPLRFVRFIHLGRIQDSGKNYYPAWYLLPLPPTLLESKSLQPMPIFP